MIKQLTAIISSPWEKSERAFSKCMFCLFSLPGTTLMLISQTHISKGNASVIFSRGKCLIKDENSGLSIVFHPLIYFMYYPFYKNAPLLWEVIRLQRQECTENISQLFYSSKQAT